MDADYTGLVAEEDDENSYAASNVVQMHPSVPQQSAVSANLPNRRMHGFMDVYNSEKVIKYVISGLLPAQGLMFIGARSGTGKTNLAIQFGSDIVLDRPTLMFRRSEDLPPQRIGIFSLEMGEAEFKERLRDMYPGLTDEQQKILQDSIFIYCDAEPFKLWKDDHAVDFIQLVRHYHLTGAIIDSASVSFAESLKDDTQVNKTIENLYMIRNRLNIWNIIVCHTRKLPAGIAANLEEATVDEIFGHSGVAQAASSVLLMHHDKKKSKADKDKDKVVWLMNPKNRFGPEFAPFPMYLPTDTSNNRALQFSLKAAAALPPLTEEQKRAANKVAQGLALGDALTDFDFGKIGGTEND